MTILFIHLSIFSVGDPLVVQVQIIGEFDPRDWIGVYDVITPSMYVIMYYPRDWIGVYDVITPSMYVIMYYPRDWIGVYDVTTPSMYVIMYYPRGSLFSVLFAYVNHFA